MQSLAHVPAGKAGAPIRILQITDTHLFPDGVVTFKTPKRTVDMKKENYSNETAERMLKILVEKVKPDIVIFTGDIIDGRPFGEHKRSDFVETFEKFLRPVIDTKIAWSFTPGNHDDDGAPYSRKDLLKLYELPCCLSAGAKTFNHTVLVGPSAKECVRLWFFDSGENADERSASESNTHRLISPRSRDIVHSPTSTTKLASVAWDWHISTFRFPNMHITSRSEGNLVCLTLLGTRG
mmetsp:Transcript_30641/g.74653  ORF Transcript_30641/g.74653 Transcript_30641/m.74653 type:complete len:237 (+) Transcript_30641:238-948(+)